MKFLVLACTVALASCAGSPSPRSTAHDEGETSRANRCREIPVGVQVLGSGGPIPDDARASSSYLVWIDGRARALIDAGGGLLPRYGASGARITDLDVIALSHLHVDHVGGLPSLLKGGYFTSRRRPLAVVGPSGNQLFPAIDVFLSDLLDPERGAFRYLSDYLSGEARFRLEPKVIDATSRSPENGFTNDRLSIDVVGVHHGAIPSLGYLVTVGDHRIAFAGDQSALDNDAFASMIDRADLLIAHHALPETGAGDVRHLHAIPSEIGDLAARAHVRRLVLSHHMQRALADLEGGLAVIRARYDGPVDVARDLDCFEL